jgi:hypothetical protein
MMKKCINEDFNTLRKSSPYKIRRDKGFVQDASPLMHQRYMLNKQIEKDNLFELQRMFGEFDKLELLFVNLFKQVTYIREFLESQLSQPLINKKQIDSVKKLVKKLDKINDIISSDMLKELDNLGAEPKNKN